MVRDIEEVVRYKNSVPVKHHAVDVDPVPEDNNRAHAEIYAIPEISGSSIFRRLQEALVRISDWEQGFEP